MSTVQMIIPANYDWIKKWEGTQWKDRTEEYEAFKKYFKEEC